ncbi:MAG: hypothetical protein AB1801_02515 [Chloroflexota bacterium]
MSKKDDYQQDLIPLFEAFLTTADAGEIEAYLTAHSNLPGPRGNLELADAFADRVEAGTGYAGDRLWQLCVRMSEVSAQEAPVNDPREFISFCGTVGLGALGLAPEFFEPALARLKTLANDPRWRMREGAPRALQRLLVRRSQAVLTALAGWLAGGSLLELRAVAAAVAEPAPLQDEAVVGAALSLHRHIFERVMATQTRKSEEFRVLRQALGYTLSVVIQARPVEGFALMAQLVDSQDPDVLWIVKENLKKKRLTRNFPQEVAVIQQRLK